MDSNAGGKPPPQPLVQGDPAPTTTRAYLAKPRTFQISASSTAEVTALRSYDGDTSETATLQVHGGSLTLVALPDGTIAVRGLDLELGSIQLASVRVPDLTNVKLSLRQEADVPADWSRDESAMNAAARTDLLLDWSMIASSGTVVPLATQRITDVPFDLIVSHRQDGRYSVDFHATRPGAFWDYAGLIALSDLKLDLDASQ